MKCESRFKKIVKAIEENLKTIVVIGSSAAAIFGACAVGFNWLSDRMLSKIQGRFGSLSAQVAALQDASASGDAELQQSTTRTELLLLIYHSPQNGAEIERVARHYFCELKGDWYMSSVYSDWAANYGGDISIITTCDPHN